MRTPIIKLAACVALCTLYPSISGFGQTLATKNAPIVEALKEIERADWDHRWTGYNIAPVGSAVGMCMGVWGLYQTPLVGVGNPDPVINVDATALNDNLNIPPSNMF